MFAFPAADLRVSKKARLLARCRPIDLLIIFLRQLWLCEIRHWIIKDIVIEPTKIVLHHRALRFWFGDTVAKSLIDNHLDFHPFVLEGLTQLIGIRDRNTSI